MNNTETDETLKIRVLNISKKDLNKTLKKFEGNAWDQSPLFKKLYEDEFGSPGGQPYGGIIGDYHFDHSPEDVKMLGNLAQIASAMHAPFIAGAAPSVLGMDSWQELSNPRDLTKILQSPEYASWRSLRESEDARYIGLAMPRFLARIPYGAKTAPVEDFDFEENTAGADHNKYVWSNAAYAMGVNVTRAFKLYGWCARIRGTEAGGDVQGLPVHTFPTDDGGVDMKCPTEIAITDRRESELAKNGLHAALALQEYRLCGVHGRTIAAKATGLRRRHCDRQCQPGRPSALPFCHMPVRPLSQMHGARQNRFLQGTRGHAGVAQQMDQPILLRLQIGRRSQGALPAGRSQSRGAGSERQSGLLHFQILAPPALPIGGIDRVASLGVKIAVWKIVVVK